MKIARFNIKRLLFILSLFSFFAHSNASILNCFFFSHTLAHLDCIQWQRTWFSSQYYDERMHCWHPNKGHYKLFLIVIKAHTTRLMIMKCGKFHSSDLDSIDRCRALTAGLNAMVHRGPLKRLLLLLSSTSAMVLFISTC